MTGIYKITSPSGRIYIGQSINIEKRFKFYKLLKCKNQIRLYNSFNKYGVENHIFEILEECSFEELNNKERFYQDKYNVTNEYGLNCRLTSSFDKCGSFKKSKEAIQKSINFHKGRKRSIKTCKNISNSLKGLPRTKEWKLNIQKSKLGNSYRSKKVINTLTNKIYESTILASIDLNINVSTLRNKLNGQKKNNTNLKYYKYD